nr:GspH/FimT family pseudopilin [Variovorax dokdonensis]
MNNKRHSGAPQGGQRGFTVVEIVVTLAVLGILMFAAMPMIGNWMANARIRSATQSLQNGLETARNEAVRRNESVTFWMIDLTDPSALGDGCTLSSTSPSWIVSINAPTGHCGDDPSTTSSPRIVQGRAAGADATSQLAVKALQVDGEKSANSITFNGFGRPVDPASLARIDVTGVSESTNYVALRLMVSNAGQVRMCDPRVTTAGDPRLC